MCKCDNQRRLWGRGLFRQILPPEALRTNQDDARHRMILHPLHIPALAHSFGFLRQFEIAIPATPLSGGANGMQGLTDIYRQSFRYGGIIQSCLLSPSGNFSTPKL